MEDENVQSNTLVEDRISNIEGQVNVIMQSDLFLVSFLVVCVVCFLLYKAIDKFISF